MSCDLNDAALDGGLAALRERSADWLLIHYAVNVKDTLQLKASGSNGLEELKVQLVHSLKCFSAGCELRDACCSANMYTRHNLVYFVWKERRCCST